MPIKPGKNETQSEWMARCVPEMISAGRPQDQAVAACSQMWRDKDKAMDKRTITPNTVIRSWSTLELKAEGDKEHRQIKGTASTPTTDRSGDIVEPMGLEFEKSIPLLYQHRHAEPVGIAKLDKPTEEGVTFTAQLASIIAPGALKSRIDDVWEMVKAGLIRGVSIGFKPLEYSFMDDGGVRFIKSEVIELSLVTIPANSEATISMIKSYDVAPVAASGLAVQHQPAASGIKPSGVTEPPSPRKGKTMKPISEQITGFEARRKSASDRMAEIMSKAADGGVTLEQSESDEYDNLVVDVKKIEEHIGRLVVLERQMKEQARPAQGGDIVQAGESREPRAQSYPVIRMQSNVPKGIPFTRYVMLMAGARNNRLEALQTLKQNKVWMSETPELEIMLNHDVNYMMKAAIAPGTTTDSVWAGPLVVAQNMASEFAEFLRPLTIIGRIPGLRRVPFNISLPRATSGTSANWVGEQAPKPVTSMAFDTVTLRWAKAAAIVVLTEELVRFSNPAAEAVVRADLAAAITYFLDRQFVDPSVAAVTNVSPASVTNGVTPVTATGTTAAAFRADTRTLFGNFISANIPTTATGVWIMTMTQALSLSLMINSLGQQLYPTVDPQTGGTLLGYPVVISENLPATGGSPADGYPIIFMIASEVMLADDGQTIIDASREASVQMDTAPDSPPSASTNMVSLWQMNMLGLRAERWINWQKRRSGAVQFIQNAKYAE